jgi:hydrogenase maturation protein HypF
MRPPLTLASSSSPARGPSLRRIGFGRTTCPLLETRVCTVRRSYLPDRRGRAFAPPLRYRWGVRRKLFVQGIVQGVGFRPWIYQLAHGHELRGYVLNSTFGVTIEIEGSDDAQLGFLQAFRSDPPPLAVIDEVREEVLEPVGYAGFEIRESLAGASEFVLVPPDVATCADCLADFRDPANRRFGYPFTNCTNCGPRYSIVRDIPYDRRLTTMAEFTMCAACETEYHDPANRRFHAQPNACPECGPWVELWDHERQLNTRTSAVHETRLKLEAGRIVAIKGLGGFHLACLASDEGVVQGLRERKRRSDKPFAVMVRDLKVAEGLCHVSDADRATLTSVRRPVVLMRRQAGARVAERAAPGIGWLGIMLPYTPLHHLLYDGTNYDALVMTSGNFSEEPIVSRNEEIEPRLHKLADYFLIHNRKIQTRVDDSVVRTFEVRERTLRRSRGFAPQPIDLGMPVKQILACGGELKNVFCLTKEHYAVLSQHIGDMENLETLEAFRETLEHMKRFFRISPEAVAYDLHPGYLSTRFALALDGVEKIGVQHHHAHIASCMAENRLEGKVIGVAFDGTGYGTDGRIWGGEFLACDYSGFERAAHFRYVPLAGGDTAVRQTWRSALAYLNDAGVDAGFLAARVSADAFRVVRTMLAKGINSIETSSCGRLFDAVAAITGVRLEANYEGQGAMEMEALAVRAALPIGEVYPFDLADGELDFRETIRGIARDKGQPELVAGRFHNTLAEAIARVCSRIASENGISRVCLSGGTFQNFYLLARAVELLRKAGLEVYLHSRVPPNDGGLSLGQAVVANWRLSSD